MRQVVGNVTRDLSGADLAGLRAGFRAVVLDVGTGNGKHVLAEARRRPDALVVGLDASADAMRAAAARAAARPARGGLPNAVFLCAAAERLPGELAGVTEVHVLMPWGSLLRALVEPRPEVLAGIAAACLPAARFLITLNLRAWRPPVPEVGATREPTPESAVVELAPALRAAGWRLEAAEYLDERQISDLATAWTKRLRSTRGTFDVLGLRGRICAGRND